MIKVIGAVKTATPSFIKRASVTLKSDPVKNDSPGHFSTIKVTPRVIFQR